MTRRSLSEILRNGDRESRSQAWGKTEAADDFTPLPTGEYECHAIAAEPFNARTKGT